jgi:asperthecin polyketide synthase
MDPILEAFEKVAQQVTFRTPSVPILSPLLADGIFDGKTVDAKYLCRATREPVRFFEALDAGRELGVIPENATFIEIWASFHQRLFHQIATSRSPNLGFST